MDQQIISRALRPRQLAIVELSVLIVPPLIRSLVCFTAFVIQLGIVLARFLFTDLSLFYLSRFHLIYTHHAVAYGRHLFSLLYLR